MSAETTLRDSLNTANPNRIASAEQDLMMGEALTAFLNGMTATEAGLVPVADVTTMAATPKALFDINVTAGASTGHKKLLKGFTAPDGTIQPVPAAGEATWDGATKVRTNAADAATAVSVKYTTTATVTPSYLQRSLGAQP